MTLEAQFAAGCLDSWVVLGDLSVESKAGELRLWLPILGPWGGERHNDGMYGSRRAYLFPDDRTTAFGDGESISEPDDSGDTEMDGDGVGYDIFALHALRDLRIWRTYMRRLMRSWR